MAKILLVDDDLTLVSRHRAMLKGRGHSVIVVTSPAQAMAAVRAQVPDLVVLEALFEGKLSGLDLARELATSHPDLPLIMLTCADELISKAKIATQDHDGWLPVARYLEKPVMEDVLADEVEHLLAD